jgi:hypothetical protein
VKHFVSRREWGAQPSRYPLVNVDRMDGIAIHWTGSATGLSASDHSRCASVVRSIQAYHLNIPGYSDVEYNLLVCPHGFVFEGRGVGKKSGANGTTDSNARFYAICALVGIGDSQPEALITGVRRALRLLRNAGNAGKALRPHSSFVSTACPGDRIRKAITSGALEPRSGGDRRKRIRARISDLNTSIDRTEERIHDVSTHLDSLRDRRGELIEHRRKARARLDAS